MKFAQRLAHVDNAVYADADSYADGEADTDVYANAPADADADAYAPVEAPADIYADATDDPDEEDAREP